MSNSATAPSPTSTPASWPASASSTLMAVLINVVQ
ncbi:hypothetical protein QBC98_005698 [Kitasatospora acidiphila]